MYFIISMFIVAVFSILTKIITLPFLYFFAVLYFSLKEALNLNKKLLSIERKLISNEKLTEEAIADKMIIFEKYFKDTIIYNYKNQIFDCVSKKLTKLEIELYKNQCEEIKKELSFFKNHIVLGFIFRKALDGQTKKEHSSKWQDNL